ncbi:N6-adenosine-methyltransferase non-catalytic subunit MTB [Linum perenne]
MDSPERGRSYSKRDVDDSLDVKGEKAGDDEDWDGSDKRKHRSSKSRKLSNGDEGDGIDGSGRRRSSGGERSENRKRSGGGGSSSRIGSDEDDYESRSKKKQEESSLEKLSNWYQDGELDGRLGGGDKSGGRGYGRGGDESDRRKATSKAASEHESSKGGSKSKEERSVDGGQEKALDKPGRSSRRRWDESDADKKGEEIDKTETRGGKSSDSKHESSKERTASAKLEQSETKGKIVEVISEKSMKSSSKDDGERNKSKHRSEAIEEDNKGSPASRDDRLGREKSEKHRQQRSSSGRDVTESREKSSHLDEDGNTLTREKGSREVARSNRSRTPERNARRHQDTQQSDVDYERNADTRRRDSEKDSHNKDDKTKPRDDNWSDRTRDRETSKDNWKRRQPISNERELKDGDVMYERGRDWEQPRHGRERIDNERPHGRNRGEAVKTSSNFGISNENYDVIEIQTKPLNYGRADSASNFTRKGETSNDTKTATAVEDWAHGRDEKGRRHDLYGPGSSAEDSRENYGDDPTSMQEAGSWRDENDSQGGKGRGQKGNLSGRGSSSSSGGGYGNQDPGSFGRSLPQGVKGNRLGRGGRGRPAGRDNQQVGLPLPMMGSPFGPLGIPPGSLQPLGPGMPQAPGPPIPPGVFIPPFPPVVWPGSRGVDMNLLGVPPSLSPIPPGPSAPRFPPNLGTPSNSGLFFNQAGPGRGAPGNIPGFNASGPAGRGTPLEKPPGSWAPSRPPGKAPSRGEQNDYSQNFVDTGMRPQNFIRELELTNVVEDYPKLRELIQKKDEIVANSASAPMYLQRDLREFDLSPEFFGTKFDVILVDPPWEEYVHRAPGVADHMEYWTFEEILNLKIEAIADTPSFLFLWVGDGVGLEQGRQCLKKWGFRRCEDICWVKTNKSNATPGLRHDSHTLFQHSKEHCLMGIKGTVRRSTDGHIIHANIDTDVIIAEEPPYGSTQKPEDMYRIIEHFSLGRRRLELFGEDHNIRAGWLTVGKELSSSNFSNEAYVKNFSDKDGKVWQGGGGRNPPPEAPHLVVTTPDIEALRPKSPMKNQQQQTASISLTAANSSNRRPSATTGNSPQNPNPFVVTQDAASSTANPSSSTPAPPPWAAAAAAVAAPLDDKVFEMYGFNNNGAPPPGNGGDQFHDFEPHRPVNLL